MDCREGLKKLKDKSIDTCVTSPPYWGLRDYGVDGQLGLEETPEEYVSSIVEIFREVKRVLKNEGTLWLNLGDSYAGSGKGQWEEGKGQKETYIATKDSLQCKIPKTPNGLKPKDLVGIPWMVAFALRADGWYLRSDIIWNKPNPMPESVQDRPTKAHEYIFLLSKSKNYYYDKDAIMEPLAQSSIQRLQQDIDSQNGSSRANGGSKLNGNMKAVFTVRGSKGIIGNPNSGRREEDKTIEVPIGRNKRTVWTIPTAKFSEAHFATFPPELIEPCVLAGSPSGGIVLDPFMGSGTTAMVAVRNQRNYIGFELNSDYIQIAKKHRLNKVQLQMI
ncbi:site-specific DNA-methyltransferase [Tissierella sp. P1]|uniref:DNA-methyltransferase n=1 Tax=Tissierella sp. P1 TaxID=1280483 RepID=UPI000BA16D58|nr:site-specific DNA-methyltransferase [Tissierella sp. P1]